MMSTQSTAVLQAEWWQAPEARHEVQACIDKLNESRRETNVVNAFRLILEGLNVLWNEKSRLDDERGRRDNQAFRDLMLSIPLSRQQQLCECNEVHALASFTPQILNLDCLRSSRQYIPGQPVPLQLQNQASREHRQLMKAVEDWTGTKDEDNQSTVLKKLAALVYVVRSNNAHGEKTAKGPDLDKTQRDRQVCKISLPAISAVTEAIFDFPSKKLITYGTLSPSESNHSILDSIKGQSWTDCRIEGVIAEVD